MNKEIRDTMHWVHENYRQRITTKQWKQILLNKEDRILFHGRSYQLIGKNLGAGVVEIYKEDRAEVEK